MKSNKNKLKPNPDYVNARYEMVLLDQKGNRVKLPYGMYGSGLRFKDKEAKINVPSHI